MGWQDLSTPVGGAPAQSSSNASDTPPGYFTIENQLGPFAAMFGYKQRDPPKSIGQQVQDVADVGRVAADQAPFLGNAVDVAGAQKRLQGTPYQGAGEALGMAGLGAGTEAVGVGRAIAGKVAPTTGDLLARIIGGGTEQSALAGAGTAGHGGSASDVGKSMLIGGVTGAVTGPGSNVKPSSAQQEADLLAKNKSAWDVAENTPVDINAVKGAVNNTRVSPGAQGAMSDTMQSRVNQIKNASQANNFSVDDVAKWKAALQNAKRAPADNPVAGAYSDALDTALGPSNKAIADAANNATSQLKTHQDISDWISTPSSAPTRIKGALADNPDFYNATPGVREILSSIAARAGDPTVAGNVGKAVTKHLAGAAIGGTVGALTGQGMPGDLAGAAVGAAFPMLWSKGMAIPTANKLRAAQYLNATGKPLPFGSNVPGWLSNTANEARQGVYGLGGSGRL